MIRLTFAVVSLALVVALAGCGGDGDKGGSSPSTGDAQTARSSGALSSEQYAAIERVYEAAVPLDELRATDRPPSQARVQTLARPLVAACDGLDSADELLSALREACLATARFLFASVDPANCSAVDTCERGFTKARAAARAVVSSSRASDRAVDSTQIPAACRRALRTPQVGYRYHRQLDARLGRLIEALRARSPADARSASAALARLGGDRVPTGRESLSKFRAGCG